MDTEEVIKVLEELLEQIDGIGILHWNGAEGLDTQPARDIVERFKKED